MSEERYTGLLVRDILTKTWNLGNEKAADFTARSEAAIGGLGTIPVVTADSPAHAIVTEPSVTISNTSTSDVMSTFDAKYEQLVALLAEKFTTFKSTNFPSDDSAYSVAENYLISAIANPDVGLPTTVSAQMLADDQARILSDAARASDAVMQTFAARRFPLPSGAAASAIIQIQNKAQDEIAESSRKLTMISVEQLKFAVSKVTEARAAAMSASLEYIKAIASGPQIASQVIGIGYDAQSKMISAASSFYDARIEAAKAVDSVAQFNASLKLKAAESNQMKDIHTMEERSKMVLAEASAIGQMAASLFNNMHTGATATLNDSTSQSI
jgi:hypothetical protein